MECFSPASPAGSLVSSFCARQYSSLQSILPRSGSTDRQTEWKEGDTWTRGHIFERTNLLPRIKMCTSVIKQILLLPSNNNNVNTPQYFVNKRGSCNIMEEAEGSSDQKAAVTTTGPVKKSPSDFLKQVLGKPVIVQLNSGVTYRGILACLDGFMNIAMEQTEEYVDGQLKNRYGDCFIRGNNGKPCFVMHEALLPTSHCHCTLMSRTNQTCVILSLIPCTPK